MLLGGYIASLLSYISVLRARLARTGRERDALQRDIIRHHIRG